MSKLHERSATAAELYAEAYATHYAERDLLGALRVHGQVISSNAGAAEAGYSRSQMRNIVNPVVLAGELLASQTEPALGHPQRDSDDAVAAVPQ